MHKILDLAAAYGVTCALLARIGAVMDAYENERQTSGLLGSHSVDVVSFSCSLGGS
jgi:hypothetical protein